MKFKIFSLCIMMLFFVTLVSAAEWDNCKETNLDNNEITIKDKCLFGLDIPFITNDIATIILETPLDYRVGAGYRKVVQFTINSKKDYSNALRLIEFYDKKEAKESNANFLDYESNIEFDYKMFKGYKNITVPTYSYQCEKVWSEFNKSFHDDCSYIQNGTKNEEVESWEKFTTKDFESGQIYTIGIFTNVGVGDSYEWIGTYYGLRLDEWSSWTQSLNVDLEFYYAMEQASGDVVDSIGNSNLTNSGATYGETGKVGDCMGFDGGENDYINGTVSASYSAFTVSAWFKSDATVDDYGGIVGGDGTIANIFYIRQNAATGDSMFEFAGRTNYLQPNDNSIDGAWHHVVLTWSDATDTGTYYIDNVSQGSDTGGDGALAFTSINMGVNTGYWGGFIDEVGIWSRVLTQAEISQLWNGSNGITWTDDFGGPTAPQVNVTVPTDGAIFVTNTTVTSTNIQCNSAAPTGVIQLNLSINGTVVETLNNVSVGQNLTINSNFNLPNGNLSYYCEGENSVGSTNSSTRTFQYKRLGIYLDSPGDTFVSQINSVIFNYTLDPANTVIANTTLYIDGVANVTNTSGTPGFYSYNVTGLTFASHNYTIQVIDTNHTVYNNGSRDFVVSALEINLNEPADNLISDNSSIVFDCNASFSGGITSLNLTFDGLINLTITNSTVNEDLNLSVIRTFSEGNHNWTCSASTLLIDSTATPRDFSVDLTKPFINITAPPLIINLISDGDTLNLNWSITDNNLDSCWYEYNLTPIEYYPNCYQESVNTSNQTGLDGGCTLNYTGTYNPIQAAFDDPSKIYDGNFSTYSEVSGVGTAGMISNYSKPDNTLSAVLKARMGNLSSPIKNYTLPSDCLRSITKIRMTSILNATGDGRTLLQCWTGTIWDNIENNAIQVPGNARVYEEALFWNVSTASNSLTCADNTTTFEYVRGRNNITIFANDTIGHSNSSIRTWLPYIILNNQTFQNTTIEGSSESFTANVTIDDSVSITSVVFNYSSTSYNTSFTTSGSDTIITKNDFAIPSVAGETNVTWWFLIELSNGVNVTLTKHNITVGEIGIDDCSANNYTLFNFSLVDETTLTAVGDDENISINYEVVLKNSGGIQLTNLTNSSESNITLICLESALGSTTLLVDVLIEYNSKDRFLEFYNIEDFNLTSTKMHQNITLYDLNDTTGQEFKFTFKDDNFNTVPNALVQVYRKYVDEGLFRLVELPRISSAGYTVLHLIPNDVIYNFIVIRDGTVLGTFNNVVANCQNPTITDCEINVNSLSSSVQPESYSNDGVFSGSLSFNEDTRTASITYSVVSGVSQVNTLNVTMFDSLGNRTACEDISFNSGGTLSCVVPVSFGNSSVMIKVFSGGTERRQAVASMAQKPSDLYGVSLVFMALIMVLTIIGLGVSDDPMKLGGIMIVGIITLTALNVFATASWVGAGATILWFIVAIVIVLIKGSNRQ